MGCKLLILISPKIQGPGGIIDKLVSVASSDSCKDPLF